MEGHDGEPPAGAQQGLGRTQPARQLAELVVHVDADCLEGAGRRVDRVARALPHRAAHDTGEPGGPGDRRLAARLDDGAGDPPGAAFLAIVADDPGEAALGFLVHHLGRAAPGRRHAHVERAVGAERKAALGGVELHRRHADIEGDAVDRLDPARGQQRDHVAIAPGDEQEAVGIAQPERGRRRRGRRVAVDAAHPALRDVEHRAGIAAGAERGVDIDRPVPRRDRGQDPIEHDRLVRGGGHGPPPFSTRRRSASIAWS